MEKKKIPYESPRTELTPVELENPICSGSADIAAPEGEKFLEIEGQKVNDGFELTSGNAWDESNFN